MGITTIAGSAVFTEATIASSLENKQDNPSKDHKEYDLRVINSALSGKNINIEIVELGERKSKVEEKSFEINPAGGREKIEEIQTPVQRANLDLDEGSYRVIASGSTGDSSTQEIEVPTEGLPGCELISVRRNPDDSINIDHLVY